MKHFWVVLSNKEKLCAMYVQFKNIGIQKSLIKTDKHVQYCQRLLQCCHHHNQQKWRLRLHATCYVAFTDHYLNCQKLLEESDDTNLPETHCGT